MSTTHHLLHNARLNNNCPQCYAADSLELSFRQEEFVNKLYSKAKGEVEEKLFCHHCNSQIYPVNWDNDIERVYGYHKKLTKPLSTGVKLKPLAYILIVIDAAAIGALIYFLK